MVIRFQFATVQFNRLDWQLFLKKPNSVASALMARMSFRPEERPLVKLQCLRLLATLKLDRAKSALISKFVGNYLMLTPEEVRTFDETLESMQEVEKQEIMEITTSWQRQGRIEGLEQGLEQGLRIGLGKALRLHFGEQASTLIDRLETLDHTALNELEQKLVPGVRLEDLQ